MYIYIYIIYHIYNTRANAYMYTYIHVYMYIYVLCVYIYIYILHALMPACTSMYIMYAFSDLGAQVALRLARHGLYII